MARKITQKNSEATVPMQFSKLADIDYKEVFKLKRYVTTRGRILEAEKTGLSKSGQKKLALAIKRARYMALLPFNEYS